MYTEAMPNSKMLNISVFCMKVDDFSWVRGGLDLLGSKVCSRLKLFQVGCKGLVDEA